MSKYFNLFIIFLFSQLITLSVTKENEANEVQLEKLSETKDNEAKEIHLKKLSVTKDNEVNKIQLKTLSASRDIKDIEALEKQLIINYIDKNYNKIDDILNEIMALDEYIYRRDKEIMDYWDYVDHKMKLYYGKPSNNLPKTSDHAFVVLGHVLNKDGSLDKEGKGRCDVAYECAIQYPNSKIFITGGRTAKGNTTVTESGQMKKYLVEEKGLSEDRIEIEKDSRTTNENVHFTLKKLYELNIKSISIVTSDYHIRRGSLLFKGVSINMSNSLGKDPIEILDNAVWKSDTRKVDNVTEEHAVLSVLNI